MLGKTVGGVFTLRVVLGRPRETSPSTTCGRGRTVGCASAEQPPGASRTADEDSMPRPASIRGTAACPT